MAKPDPSLLEIDRYPVRIELPTRFQDLDPNKHINNVALAAFFEEARVRFDHGLGLHEIALQTGMRAMIASLQIEYLGEAFYPMPIEVYIGTAAIGRSSWSVAAIGTQGANLVNYMRATIVNLDSQGPAPIPTVFRKALAQHQIRL